MSGKKYKMLRRKSRELLIEWIKTLVPEGEDTSKINKKNLHEFIPKETHILSRNKLMLSAYSPRWFYKKIKRNPDITLETLND